MAIFQQTNKFKYKHADYLYIYHWETTSNESNAGLIRSFMRLPNVSSQLCTFSCCRQKNCLLVLCSKRPFLSRSAKTIYGSPCCSHQATTVQFLNRPQYVCYGNRRRNMATKLRSVKVKNKLPVGGRLWILFESIWLKIEVIVCQELLRLYINTEVERDLPEVEVRLGFHLCHHTQRDYMR